LLLNKKNFFQIKKIFSSLKFQEKHILSSFPPGEVDKLIFADRDTWLVIILSISLFSLLIETFFILKLILPIQFNFFSLISHTFACLILLKFVVDEHPFNHFWISFGIFNCPQLIFLVYFFVKKYFLLNYFYLI